MKTLDETYINEYGNYYWKIIHLEAFKLWIKQMNNDNENYLKELIEKYLSMLLYIGDNFLCSCKNHFQRMIIKNPYWTSGLNIFHWTILLHNTVNKRLNKPIMNYKDVYLIYSKYLIEN